MRADVQGVGESVLLDLEGYQFLMTRDDARLLGAALLRVVASRGDVLDDLAAVHSSPSATATTEPASPLPDANGQGNAT